MNSPAGNQGLLLRPTLPINNFIMTYRFASANHSDPAWRPKLVVSYTLPGQEQGASGREAGLASLALQPAPEATPPANHTWRSYYHAAGQRVATPALATERSAEPALGMVEGTRLGSGDVSVRADNSATVVQR